MRTIERGVTFGLFYLLLIFIPFGTRDLIYHVIAGFHEYESLFIYASDIFLIGALLGIFFFNKRVKLRRSVKRTFIPLFIFLVAALVSVFVSFNVVLAIYVLIRLLLLIGFLYLVLTVVYKRKLFAKTLAVIATLSVIQGIIGILQFSRQGSLGLHLLGESYLSSLSGPASTIPFAGGSVLRAYGTFPHPNIFGAFLVLGIISLAYLYIYLDKKLYTWEPNKSVKKNFERFMSSSYFYLRILVAAGILVNTLGLAVSFSRGAWASAIFGLAVFIIMAIFAGYSRAIGRLIVVLLFCFFAVYFSLSSMLLPRAQLSSTDDAVNYRLVYNEIGAELINTKPLGVGIGNQVIYSVQNKVYQNRGLDNVWEWEPIHNLYLLMGSEVGIVGGLSFLVFILMILVPLVLRRKNLERSVALAVLTALLVFGLFDHFLWTIQPGRLMLWFVLGIGLVAIQLKNKEG